MVPVRDMSAWIKSNRRLFAWMPVFVWACVIFFLSVLPFKKEAPSFTLFVHFDKIGHFLEYAVLSVLMVRGLRHDLRGFSRAGMFGFTLISAGAYGIVLELAQRFIPGRDPGVGDAVMNICGTLAGLFIGRIFIWPK